MGGALARCGAGRARRRPPASLVGALVGGVGLVVLVVRVLVVVVLVVLVFGIHEVGGVQERALLGADVDEGGLDARQDRFYPAQ